MPVRKLKMTGAFKKAYLKFSKRNKVLKISIDKSISELAEDAFASNLKTHKLSGNLYGLFACSCGYDCRIIFSIQKENSEEMILLIDIGTHEEIY